MLRFYLFSIPEFPDNWYTIPMIKSPFVIPEESNLAIVDRVKNEIKELLNTNNIDNFVVVLGKSTFSNGGMVVGSTYNANHSGLIDELKGVWDELKYLPEHFDEE